MTIRDTRSKFAVADAPQDGPGQMLTHYSPRVSASLLTPASIATLDALRRDGSATQRIVVQRGPATYLLAKTALIDYSGILQAYKGDVLAYFDLSAEGDVDEACFRVFQALRWSEEVAGVENVVFPFLSEWPQVKSQSELLEAVEDRLFRAASGTVASLAVLEE
ncbi:hypothetical protein STCU_00068 [Strigomonas culicis]|nr:hypothetical protein STCU_00068 [Strigomonas culicis]|eukprot:EPY37229.1 hypothetical protein STCU_00068 [Strigomonas culicis]